MKLDIAICQKNMALKINNRYNNVVLIVLTIILCIHVETAGQYNQTNVVTYTNTYNIVLLAVKGFSDNPLSLSSKSNTI